MSYSLFQTLIVSRQDMYNQLSDLDIISNNLANLNTVGFKANRGNFQELLAQARLDGTSLVNTQVMMQQGALSTTDNPLDWAIEGEGFFQVKLPDGTTGYSRDGQFHIDANRTLVNTSGFPLVWQGQVPEGTNRVTVLPDGTVQGYNSLGQIQNLGSLQLARFDNPSGLKAFGQNLYIPSLDSGQARLEKPGVNNTGAVQSSTVEASNINMADEMENMMTLQRSFQMSVQAFQQTDTMINEAIHMRKG